MNIYHIYADSDGESHFEDTEIVIEDKGNLGRSELMKATGLFLGEMDSEHGYNWHNAPRRQFVITLEGGCEIEIGDGTKRVFKPGDILLAEDTTGRGHICRLISKQHWKTFFVTLD